MTTTPGALSPAAIVATLRGAGCVFAEDEAELLIATATTDAELADMVDRRISGLPLEQVLGWADFHGLRILLEPRVFVPRRRTEFLVREAVAAYQARSGDRGRTPVVVDLCCGSGALGAAVAAVLGGVEVHAVDIDPAAVRCARRNLPAPVGQVYQGDLYEPLPGRLRGRVDLLLANVPYVPSGDVALLPMEARVHEPRHALDGGADGLDVLRRVANAAPNWLAPGGHLLVETTDRQASPAVRAVAGAGLLPRLATCPDLDATVLAATLPFDS
jgi:release factor glutamine methyltransferase